jgi:transcriptional regulator with XRE-family HTH domain
MYIWTSKKIRELRLRHAWSVADFARRLDCSPELISEWEKGLNSPSPEKVMQLNRLEFQLDDYCEQVVREPMAECALKSGHLAQVCTQQIHLILKDT